MFCRLSEVVCNPSGKEAMKSFIFVGFHNSAAHGRLKLCAAFCASLVALSLLRRIRFGTTDTQYSSHQLLCTKQN